MIGLAVMMLVGTISAAVLVDETFRYENRPVANLAVNSDTGLSGSYAPNSTATISDGGFTGQAGFTTVNLANPIRHKVGSDKELWLSYRHQQNGREFPLGGNGAGVGVGFETYTGAFFSISDSLDGTWVKGVASARLGQKMITSERILFDIPVDGCQQDYLIIGRVTFGTVPHISMAIYNWGDGPSSETDIVWEIDADIAGINDEINRDYKKLLFCQSGENPDMKFDNVLIGDTAPDVGIGTRTLGIITE